MPKKLIYLIAFVEWFSTLAVEIIAIRLAIPVVWSSIVLTSIFLWIVLLALSAGYRSGGTLSSLQNTQANIKSLSIALVFSGVWYVMIAFSLERGLLEILMKMSDSYILTLFIVAGSLFFIPVFVASHTIPLLTEILDEPSKWKAAWSMLFASTLWSFFGSIVTSIWFFQRWWVRITGILVWVSLILLAWIVLYRQRRAYGIFCVILAGLVWGWWRLLSQKPEVVYSFDSAYQKIEIQELIFQDRPTRLFKSNDGYSSAIFLDGRETTPFTYINETISISDWLEPTSILVIGAAWFTYPQLISNRSYVTQIDTVDIDPAVKRITETYFLEEELDEKITFYPVSARAAVKQLLQDGKEYDLILLDAYNGKSFPEELVSLEFFEDVLKLQTQWGVVIANMILDKNLDSVFTRRAFATMQHIFWSLRYTNVSKNPKSDLDNFIVSTQLLDWYTSLLPLSQIPYTDDRNSAGMDGMRMMH